MSEIAKSMQDALKSLDAQADSGFDSDPVPETENNDISFDLNKSEDLEEIDGEKIDVDPFLKGIAATIDGNNGRIARAIEGTMNLVKAQSAVIIALTEKLDDMQGVLDEMATAPAQAKAALTKSEAEQLQTNLFTRDFQEPTPAPDVGVVPGTAPQNIGMLKAKMVATLRKAYDSGAKTLGSDILNLDSVPNGFQPVDMLSILSPEAQKVIQDAMPTETETD